ncbi:MAG: Crp/Fnr family transcriptional regulator [Phaeodactylibacter sp.]|nr:Crp/Fnr family transcriptional regulator [Phaeodactylibacter sp.]
MDRLRTALSFGGILPESMIERAVEVYHEKHLKPQEFFMKSGQVAHSIGFVNEGILRSYTLDENGEEVTKYFIRQNQFVVHLESYYNLQPTNAAIQAVTDTHLYIIHRSDWERLIEEFPKLFILSKSLSEATLLNKIKDNDFLNYGTALDKYREFLRRYPDLALQVPQQYIASYLKITPQSLSRIRRQLAED